MFNFRVKVKGELFDLKGKSDRAVKKAQFALDNIVLRDSQFFIPKDMAFLEGSGFTFSRLGDGIIQWGTPYARRLYFNPQYNFSKDKNPFARGLWFEEAKAQNLNSWVSAANKVLRGEF